MLHQFQDLLVAFDDLGFFLLEDVVGFVPQSVRYTWNRVFWFR